MNHNKVLDHLVTTAEKESNILGFFVFGSVASGTHHSDSDIDVITILKTIRPTSGINNWVIDGIKVGNLFLTYDVLVHSVETVPYLLYPLAGAKLLFERDDTIKPLFERVKHYFADRPELVDEWNQYHEQQRAEKAEFGYERTTIIDVWNALEKRYSGGKIKRRFFNPFYMTNPRIFALVKKLLMLLTR